MVTYFLSTGLAFLSDPRTLLLTTSVVLIFKSLLLGAMIRLRIRFFDRVPKRLLMLLIVVLSATLFIEASWVLKLLRKTAFPTLSYDLVLFALRLGWFFFIVQYLAFSFFIARMINPHKNPPYHALMVGLAALLGGAQIAFIMLAPYDILPSGIDLTLYKTIYWFLIALLLVTLLYAYKTIRSQRLPKIVTAQLKVFIPFIVIPHFLFEFILCNPFFITAPAGAVYPLLNIAKILFTYGLYFSARRIMGLRFLNFSDHVVVQYQSAFVNDFTHIIEQLAHVTNATEIKYIAHTFFKQAFDIPTIKTHTHLQSSDYVIEHYTEAITHYLKESKLLIRDELEFSHFYQPSSVFKERIDFLNAHNADVFIPIFVKNHIVGSLIIERDARPGHLFTTIDRDEMTIFATYVGSIITLLEHGDISKLVREQKKLTEELYSKHQEINQYKESMRSFLRSTRERKIGIIFYKNRRFSFGNQAAQELITINPHHEEGHVLSHALKKLALDTQTYRTTQTTMTKDVRGAKLMLTGIPSLDDTSVIIVAYYPEIADTIRTHLEHLKDPSDWDYLLYLETTEPGRLITELIPGSSETLLNFKIQMLKAALSRKALLLDVPTDDLRAMVDIIHHISLRSELQIMSITTPEKGSEIGLQLFGINALYGTYSQEKPLLEKLNGIGALFIENVDLLSLETQNALADCISHGYFKPLKSDKKIPCSVRFIFSSHHNLEQKVKEGTFSAALFEEIALTTLHLPPLASLPTQELHHLIDGYVEQSIDSKELKHILELSEKERARIVNQRPLSLQEFKDYVADALSHKSTKKKINEITFNSSAYAITDPELYNAVILGKRALKDPRIMALLWKKVNNQTKIAALLGVNRSSVNRRCKEYNLL